MKRKIIVIGSSNVDFIMKMDHLPEKGETVTDAHFMQTFGGKGANQAVGAAKAGGDVSFVNCVGDDPFAPLLLDALTDAGVNVEHVWREIGIASGTALVMVGGAGMNYLSVAPGANYRLTPERLRSLASLLHHAALVVLQFEISSETLYAAIDLGEELGVPLLFNLAPARPFDEKYLRKIKYLVVNENEAGSLCGFPVDTPEQVTIAAESLLAKGAQAVLITLGAQGAYIAGNGLRVGVPAFPVEAIDTTGAGDVFCGALAVALVEGKSLLEAARFACAASSISVTRLGAQPSAPARAEIDAFLAKMRLP